MAKFSLKKLLPKYLFEQVKDDDEEDDVESPELPKDEYDPGDEKDIPQPSIKSYIDKDDDTTKFENPLDTSAYKKLSDKREKEEADYVTVVRPIKKDVTIHGYVLNKGPKPYTLEFEVFFYFIPTQQFVNKHKPVQYKRDRYKDYLEAPENILAFLKDVGKKFGKSYVFDQVETLKKKIENNPTFFRAYPLWDWGEPKIAYLNQKHYRSIFIRGSEENEDDPTPSDVSHKSFQTADKSFNKYGYVIRFELPKKLETNKQINELVAWKAENFAKGLLELPAFKSDENFTLKPGKIE